MNPMYPKISYLSIFSDEIKEKLNILKSMDPKNIEDFIPLMIVDTAVLDEYKCSLVDKFAIGSNHPIYYFSEKLEVSLALKIDILFPILIN